MRNLFYALLAVVILILIPVFGVGVGHGYYVFGVIIPYIAFAAFVGGIIYRVVMWGRSPVPFRIPTVCGQEKSLPWIQNSNLESPHNKAGVVGRMILEVILFRSLFRNLRSELKGERLIFGGRKYLWLGGILFHWALFTILFRHLRFFTEPIFPPVLFVQNLDGLLQVFLPVIFSTDVAILIALAYLFIRRIIYADMRYISLPSDYFALLLILSVVICGVITRLVFRADIIGVKELAMGMISFHPSAVSSSVIRGIGLPFYVHLFLVCSLIAYFPFSKMAHMMGIFLSPTRNLANNNRMLRHVNPWNPPVKVHTYEEYEDEWREKMKRAGIPVEKEES